MKRVGIGLIVTLVASWTLAGGQRRLVEGIVVRVNDRVLTTADMKLRVQERAGESGRPVPQEQYAEIVGEAADELCLLERATELKLDVTNEEIAQSMEQLKEQNHVTSDAQFESTLRNMGMTVDQLKARLKQSILVNRVLSREVGNMPITDEELKQRYAREQDQYRIPERVHLEHVVLPVAVDGKDRDQVLATARRLAAAARAGQKFADLVQIEVAAGKGSGGDLGTMAISDLRSEVRDVVEKVKTGEISDAFTSPAGIHVVHVIERLAAAPKPFADVAEEIRQKELSERYHAKLKGVVDGLKTRYVVEIHPELFTPTGS